MKNNSSNYFHRVFGRYATKNLVKQVTKICGLTAIFIFLITISYAKANSRSVFKQTSPESIDTIGGGCEASFTYVVSGYTVQFTDNSYHSDSVVRYHWDFGDGDTSNSENPDYTYATSAYFQVCLTIYSDSGCSSQYCSSVAVGPKTGCQASFNSTIISDETVQFHSTSTTQDSVVHYLWNFGDGDTSNAAAPYHTFASYGAYRVCLSITSAGGCTASACSDSFAIGQCTATFSYTYATGSTVNFTGQAYSADTVTSYSWSFGDGETSTSQNPSHDYSAFGTYRVIFTMGASNGCSASDTQSVRVPQGTCNASFTYTTSGDTVYFTNTSTSNGTITSYMWNFGGTDTSSSQNPTHIYSSGNYLACLAINSDSGCTANVCDSIVLGGGTPAYTITGYINCDSTPSYPATVYLIQYNSIAGTLTAVNTTTTNDSGDFTFTGVAAGSYLVKGALDSSASNYSSCLPTYGESALYWDSSAIYYNASTNPFVTIHMIGGTNLGGPGFIGGLVSSGAGGPRSTGVIPDGDVEVLLLDANGHPLEYRYTNDTGKYLFSSLAYGTYELRVEFPGKTSQVATITLSSSNPSATGVDFTVLSTYVATGIQNIISNPVNSVGQIYPNPTSDIANLEIQLNTGADMVLGVYNMIGQQVYSYTNHIAVGSTLLNIPTATLESGVYFVEIRVNDSATIVRKLIKE